jgi:hypothetical protein
VPRQFSPAALYLAPAPSAEGLRASEIAIGTIGLLLLLVLPLVGHVYTAWGGYGVTGYLLRGLVASICLLPPTLAMGATLPAVARWVQTTPTGVSWLGFFYAGNIAGAVMGTLLAGFYLLRVFDMSTATYVAAAINFAVGGLGLLVAARTPATAGVMDSDPNPESPAVNPSGSSDRALVYVAIALSGFCAWPHGSSGRASEPPLRRVYLHLLAHPRLPDRARYRQQPGERSSPKASSVHVSRSDGASY